MLKKCLSMLLVVAMLLSVLPMGVFADEEPPAVAEVQESVTIGDNRDGSVTAQGDGLVLVAIYDEGGAHLVASALDEKSATAEIEEGVTLTGECVAKAFLLDEDLTPLSMAKTSVEIPEEETETNDAVEAAEAVEETEAPTEETEAPTEETEAPAEETEAPTEETEAPAEETEAPAEETEASEELTVEEAAQEGFYVAPEGAQLVEETQAQDMAVFTGKTVEKGNQLRTSTFTGLMPGELYLLAVSKSTDLQEVLAPENLVFADAKEALADGTLSFENYRMTTGEAVIVQLYGYSNDRSIRFKGLNDDGEVDADGNVIQNLTLDLNDTFDLGIEVTPAQWAKNVQWDCTNASVSVAPSAEGVTATVTANHAGIAYVTATVTHGAHSMTAICRVRVINSEAEELNDVELVTTSITQELYRTEGTLISILPQFNEKQTSTQAAFGAAEGHLLTKAEFGTDKKDGDSGYEKEQANAETMNRLFDLEVMDDWTLRLTPTADAVEYPTDVASKYVSKIVLETEEGTIVTDKTLTVNVKKSTPKLTASSIAINSFYDTKSYELDIKGATVTGVSPAEGKTFPDWLNLDETGKLTPGVVDQKSHSGKVYLSVETEEWAVPAEVAVSVSMTYKARALRLSAKSVTLASSGSTGATIQLLSNERNTSLDQMLIADVSIGGDLSVEDFDLKTGKMKIVPDGDLTNQTVTVTVFFEDTNNVVELPLQIKTAKPVLHLEKTSVTMNTKFGDVAEIGMYMTPADAALPEDLDVWVTDSRNKEPGTMIPLDANIEDGCLVVKTDAQVYDPAYRVHVQDSDGKDLAVLSVKTLSRTTNPSVSLKTAGTLDLAYPNKGISLTRTYRNMVSPSEDAKYQFTLKVNGKSADFDSCFEEREDGKFYLLEDADVKKGDKLEITYTMELDDCTINSNKVTLTVKHTAVNMKLSKTNVTLNMDMGESAVITYSYTPADKDVKKDETPVVELTDNRGNDAEGALHVTAEGGKLTVSTDGAFCKHGNIYKVNLKAAEGEKAVTLIVKIATTTNSKVTYTASVSGTLDPTRDASKVTLSYTVRNYADTNPSIRIMDVTADEDVTGLFNVEPVSKKPNQRTITKRPASVLDTNHTYQIVVTNVDSSNKIVTAKPATMKVKAGSTSVKADRTVTIYRADKMAGYQFKVTGTDKKLNNVEKLTVKDSKQALVYKIIPLGDGSFEIYVSADNIGNVKAGNLTLNYYIRGMVHTDKKGNDVPNGTVNLKIAVK